MHANITPTMHHLMHKLYTAPSSTINYTNSPTILNNLRRTGTGTTSQPGNCMNRHRNKDMGTHTSLFRAPMLNLYPPPTTSHNVVGPIDVINDSFIAITAAHLGEHFTIAVTAVPVCSHCHCPRSVFFACFSRVFRRKILPNMFTYR